MIKYKLRYFSSSNCNYEIIKKFKGRIIFDEIKYRSRNEENLKNFQYHKKINIERVKINHIVNKES